MTAVSTAGVEEFADAVTALDAAAGRAVVRSLIGAGADPLDVIDQVITPSQHQVGLRWQRAEWTVTQQHAATEVAIAAADELRGLLPRADRRQGHVVLACAEREWHGLPIRLVAIALATAGWETTVLGAGVSPVRLGRHLHELGPDAAALSCSVLAGLPTTRRFIEASAAAGVPTVVGGAAFGTDRRRAAALGATSWAPSAAAAVRALAELPLVAAPVPALPRAQAAELAALQDQRAGMLVELGARWQPFGSQPPDRRQPDSLAEAVRDCLGQSLHAIAAAVLTGDPTVLAQTRDWVLAVLAARGAHLAAADVAELGDLLATAVREYPRAAAMLSAGW